MFIGFIKLGCLILDVKHYVLRLFAIFLTTWYNVDVTSTSNMLVTLALVRSNRPWGLTLTVTDNTPSVYKITKLKLNVVFIRIFSKLTVIVNQIRCI